MSSSPRQLAQPPSPPKAPKPPDPPGNAPVQPPSPPKPPDAPRGASEQPPTPPAAQEWRSEAPQSVTLDSRFDLVIGVSAVPVDDDLVLADPLSDRYFRVNQTGAFLWQRIATRHPLRQVADELARIYRLDTEEAGRVVLNFANELANSRLVVHVDQLVSPHSPS